MTVKDIFTKYALLSKNSNTSNIIFYGLLVQTIILFIYEYYVSRNIKLKDKNNDKIVACKDKLIIVVVGIILYGYIYTLTNACKLAPNIGFVKSIDTLGIVATILLSNLIFKTKVNKQLIYWNINYNYNYKYNGCFYIKHIFLIHIHGFYSRINNVFFMY